jgi:hypothetical protein
MGYNRSMRGVAARQGRGRGWGGAAVLVVALAVAIMACRSRHDREQAAATSAAPRAVDDFYREYQRLHGAERLRHFSDGVVVVGTVGELSDEGDEEPDVTVAMVVGGGRVVLHFADGGSALAGRGVAVGTSVTARCQVTGSTGGAVFLDRCVLQ